MKKLLLLILSAFLACGNIVAEDIQVSKWEAKTARKVAKKLSKQGWKTFPEDLPMAQQLINSWNHECEYKEITTDGVEEYAPFYLFARGESNTCKTLEEAETQANEWAKLTMYELYATEYPSTQDSSKIMTYILCERLDYALDNTTNLEMYSINIEVCRKEMIRKTVIFVNPDIISDKIEDKYVINDTVYWDAARKTCFQEPIVTNAQPLLRLYREVPDGYQVQVRCCSENIKYDE